MAEPIEMAFGVQTLVHSRNHGLDGGVNPPGKGAILRASVTYATLVTIGCIHGVNPRISASGLRNPSLQSPR